MKQNNNNNHHHYFLSQRQDVRSLAAFRILCGIYLMYDILSRLQHGRLSLLWYTSTDPSFLHPDDTPHRSPIHRIWFYRGSEVFQLCLFLMTFLLALSFAMGYKCNAMTKTLLWLNVVSMQCRCMPPHDGSDAFFRNMLLWCIHLPVSQVWSIDSRRKQQHHHQQQPVDYYYCHIDNRAAVWGLRLQIVCMYLGTVATRTIDPFGFWQMTQSQWLPPQLTAVYYSLSSSFATRQNYMTDLVRANLPLSQFMTFMAMMIEGFAPILCLVTGDSAHIPAFCLFQLHFGLLLMMNLPNWQFVGMLTTVVWIPSWIWDSLQRSLALQFPQIVSLPTVPESAISIRKKHDSMDSSSSINEKSSGSDGETMIISKRRRLPRPGRILTWFFLTYMLYDFSANREWIPKIDHGDVGEFLRFTQYWVMFSFPPKSGFQIMLTGSLTPEQDNVNVWEWIRSGNIELVVDWESPHSEIIWTNMTHVYPSPRLERAFAAESRWPKHRSQYFLRSLCQVTPFDKFRMILQKVAVVPPANSRSGKRYNRIGNDEIVEVKCS